MVDYPLILGERCGAIQPSKDRLDAVTAGGGMTVE